MILALLSKHLAIDYSKVTGEWRSAFVCEYRLQLAYWEAYDTPHTHTHVSEETHSTEQLNVPGRLLRRDQPNGCISRYSLRRAVLWMNPAVCLSCMAAPRATDWAC